jgi:hypothetical protein
MGGLTTGCNQPLSILIARSMLSKRPIPIKWPMPRQLLAWKLLVRKYIASLTGRDRRGVDHCGTYSCRCLPMAECGHRFGELKRVRGGAAIRRESDVGAAPALPIVAQ